MTSQIKPEGLSVDEVLSSMRVISEVIGGDWLLKKTKQEKKVIEQLNFASKNRKHAYLYKPEPHPLVAWVLEFELWRNESIKSGVFELSESVLKLAILGQSLDRSRYQSGFKKLISRLKQKESFFSAAFEVEVAAIYCNSGCKVHFVEENRERTPDLRVTTADGSHFWVECKLRDRLTDRDAKVEAIWMELQASIVREIGPKRQNAILIVKSVHDPKRDEISELLAYLLESLRAGGIGKADPITGQIDFVFDPTEKYLVAVQLLEASDDEIEGVGLKFQSSEKLDYFLMAAETRVDENNRRFFRNPFAIGFVNSKPSDKVSGIIHGFKSAVGQLPKDGPGVVWIRVPDNSWNDDFDAAMLKAEGLFKSELNGEMNRRVNAVVLMTRVLHQVRDGAKRGLVYRPMVLAVNHENPRNAIDWLF